MGKRILYALPLNIKVFTVVLLLLATTGLFKFVQRYEPSGTELLQNGRFHQGLANWSIQGDKDTITESSDIVVLKNRDATRSISLRQILPLPSRQNNKVMLVAEISTEGVERGEMPWHKACLYLASRNREGKSLWNYPHMVTALTGDNNWDLFSRVFPLIEEASELVVGISLNHATGVMLVRNLSLKPVRERTGFHIAVYCLISCWCVVLFWTGIPLFRHARPNLVHGLLVVVMVCIFIGVMIPGATKEKLFSAVQKGYAKVVPSSSIELQSTSDPQGSGTEILHFVLEGMAHFTLFAGLAILLRQARPGDNLFVQGLYLMLFAATTEVLQFFTIDRGPTFDDWLFDFIGLSTGLFLLTLIQQKGKRIC